jgi:hypothetical protein
MILPGQWRQDKKKIFAANAARSSSPSLNSALVVYPFWDRNMEQSREWGMTNSAVSTNNYSSCANFERELNFTGKHDRPEATV